MNTYLEPSFGFKVAKSCRSIIEEEKAKIDYIGKKLILLKDEIIYEIKNNRK